MNDNNVPTAEQIPESIQAAEPNSLEWGKVMRLYWTRMLPKVAACGHRYDENNIPRTNCEYCWFAYFQMHGELTSELDKAYREDGAKAITLVYGKKFFTMFLRFMSTVAKFVREQEALKALQEIDGNSNSVQGIGQPVQDNEQEVQHGNELS